MSRYPDDPRPISPYPFRVNRPFVGGGPEWAPQTRPLTSFSLLEVDLSYRGKSWDQIMTLHTFFESVDGAAGRFTFVDFNGIRGRSGTDPGVRWIGLFVAKADGLTIEWDLPTFSINAPDVTDTPQVYENGSAKLAGFWSGTGAREWSMAYDIEVGGGTDDVDLLRATASLTTVATAPSPATTGTSLVVHAGDGAHFPTPPFYANVWPTSAAPTAANVETVQVTGITTDTPTIVRAQKGTIARSIVVGDQIAVPPADTVVLTIDATCRRAMRRARFTAAKNPFVLNVPANYYQGPVTIVEVR